MRGINFWNSSRMSKSIPLPVFVCGFVLSFAIAIHATVSPPPDYSTAKLEYGTSLANGLSLEVKSYGSYLDTVEIYRRDREMRITGEFQTCYKKAQNATESKVCADNSQKQETDLGLEMRKIKDGSFVEFTRRKDLIKKYWAQKSGK
jgi:hypothetical protein